VLSGR